MKITDRLLPGDRYRTAGVDPATPRVVDTPAPQDDAFTRAVGEARTRDANRPTLSERLDALARPQAGVPGGYANARSIELLQHVIDSVLPSLDAEDEVVALAQTVIGEELDWRQAWEGRMNEAASLPPSSDFVGEEDVS